MKKIIKSFPLLALLLFLTACNKQTSIDKNTTNSISEDNNNDSSITTTERNGYSNLTINTNRCRGCGKCAQIDPEHFSMSNRTAQITSTKNLDSTKLTMAISMCHDRAIILS